MKKYKDLELAKGDFLVADIQEENIEQLEKWGIQSVTLPEWMLFLTEEVGELADAIGEFVYRKGSANDIYHEAIQTATLALKIAETVRFSL